VKTLQVVLQISHIAKSGIGKGIDFEDAFHPMEIEVPQPLFLYAAEFWPHHFEIASAKKRDHLWSMALKLCELLPGMELPDWFIWYWLLRRLIIEPVPTGFTPLKVAAAAHITSITEHFVESGADLKARTSLGDTVLDIVAQTGHPEILDLLLAQGCSLETNNLSGMTPLHQAVYNAKFESTRLLLSRGADIETKDDGTFRSLNTAASSRSVDIVRLLLKHRLVIEATNCEGFTALLSYCQSSVLSRHTDHDKRGCCCRLGLL
jgi:hypothetical protein